jgi:cell wall-associated NlpC family hydrolase
MSAVIRIVFVVCITNCFVGCANNELQPEIKTSDVVEIADTLSGEKTIIKNNSSPIITTGNATPEEIVAYAKTLLGVPYLYASADPAKGFDCSGFITYVFNHFNISVPRSSVDFTNVGTEISDKNAAPGDLILFTGTNSTIRVVGHMGIVESNKDGKLQFIHSTSGNAKGVVITLFDKYYRNLFVKFIRIFPDAYFD